jgi:hypothetical protein
MSNKDWKVIYKGSSFDVYANGSVGRDMKQPISIENILIELSKQLQISQKDLWDYHEHTNDLTLKGFELTKENTALKQQLEEKNEYIGIQNNIYNDLKNNFDTAVEALDKAKILLEQSCYQNTDTSFLVSLINNGNTNKIQSELERVNISNNVIHKAITIAKTAIDKIKEN